MSIRTIVILSAILLACPFTSQAQPFSNRPGVRPELNWQHYLNLFVTLTIESPAPDNFIPVNSNETQAVLSGLHFPVGDDLNVVSCSIFSGGSDGPSTKRGRISIQSKRSSLENDDRTRILAILRDKLKAPLAANASLSPDERSKRLAEIGVERSSLEQKLDALFVLQAAQGDATSVLTERIKQLRQDIERLQMESDGKQARRKALEMALSQQRAQAEADRKNDAIAIELQKLVQLREADYQRAKQLAASSMTSQREVAEAEAALSETRIRLAEREASLGKAGKGELIDRLSDELVMVSVDATDNELRLAQARNELKKYDTASINADALNKLLDQEPDLRAPGGQKSMPAADELNAQLDKLYSESFYLKVADLNLTEDPNPPGRGGRRGGGGRGSAPSTQSQ